MIRSRGLGRGLDVLLGNELAGAAPADGDLREVAVGELRPGRFQPRTRMSDAGLDELTESIRAQGVIQPVVVRPVLGGFEIIAGERRWRAAQRAGLERVPVVVRAVSDNAALAMALIENIQREDLNPLEEAQGIQRLIEEFGLTHQAAADAVGRSRVAVTNLLRLLNLTPPVQAMLLAAEIEMGHARALLTVDGAAQVEWAQRAMQRGMTVRELEKALASAGRKTAPPAEPDPDVAALERRLADRFGRRVEVRSRGNGGGALVLHFDDADDFDTLLGHLAADGSG
ncbi:MAG: ParB/RepB/Spo0J family partition protein [Rhodocyclaceae bacterium]|nr:ParB/RepB/Spo0J family partition protein [Rhodocyclaceae bacterium]